MGNACGGGAAAVENDPGAFNPFVAEEFKQAFTRLDAKIVKRMAAAPAGTPLQKAFYAFDMDDDGQMTLSELQAGLGALGVPRLGMIEGQATDVLAGLDAPDAIFIGGGASTPSLIDLCWEALQPRGRLVANVVTLEGEIALSAFRERRGGDLTRIAVSRADDRPPPR